MFSKFQQWYEQRQPRPTPMEKGVEMKTREQALWLYADWELAKPNYQPGTEKECWLK